MATIFIIDDDAINRELLHAYLDDSGHTLIDAESGEEALELIRKHPPDLVLCDVVMPKLNGFDLTRRLKAESATQFLPVVLLTSLNEPASRLLGLRAGADDFLVKPIDRLELVARCTSLLNLRQKDVALVQRNIELLELHRRRDDMTAMIVHDLRNPVAVILANLVAVQGSATQLIEDDRDALNDAITAGRRMQRLLANLLDLARLDTRHFELHKQPTPLQPMLDAVFRQRSFALRSREIKSKWEVEEGLRVNVDGDLLIRTFENILDNAIRYTPTGGRIEVQCRREGGQVVIRLGNSGAAIPREARARVFEKYAHASSETRGHAGLGLYFCRLVAEAHNGSIEVDESETLPVVFRFTLPDDAEIPTAV